MHSLSVVVFKLEQAESTWTCQRFCQSARQVPQLLRKLGKIEVPWVFKLHKCICWRAWWRLQVDVRNPAKLQTLKPSSVGNKPAGAINSESFWFVPIANAQSKDFMVQGNNISCETCKILGYLILLALPS